MVKRGKYSASEAIRKEEFITLIEKMSDRDKALFCLLWLTGLRVSEALALKPVNITEENVLGHPFIYVRAKTLKRARLRPRSKAYRKKHPETMEKDLLAKEKKLVPMRSIPISLERDGDLWANVQNYMRIREPLEKIFKITPCMVWRVAKKHGIGKTHNTRHSFTTECFRRGLQIPQVQDLNGWKTLKMMEVYRHEFVVRDVAKSMLIIREQEKAIEK